MNFRQTQTSSGKTVFAGRTAENNEELVRQSGKNEIVLHTKEAGSPFVNIKGKANKKDVEEAAVFCAKYSRDWKKNKSDVEVHVFFGKDIYKDKGMKTGTFGVKKFKVVKIKKEKINNYLQ